jgi:mannose-6-phosphate isomerase-like protein (cupin superfamily)
MSGSKQASVPYVLIKKKDVLLDGTIIHQKNKLGLVNNNGRKIFANKIMTQYGEERLIDTVWRVPNIYPTGGGGIEIATFTEFSQQDRHKHKKGTEIYTVLKGTMQLFINDGDPLVLLEGDEIVILPNTVHEIVQQRSDERKDSEDFKLLVRVHSLNCYGASDKFIQFKPKGAWKLWKDLSKEQQRSAYKRQAAYNATEPTTFDATL